MLERRADSTLQRTVCGSAVCHCEVQPRRYGMTAATEQFCRAKSATLPRRANHFRLAEIVSSPSHKNISVLPKHELGYTIGHPVPARGAFRERHRRRGGDAVDAVATRDGRCLLRMAKSCGSGTLRLVSSSQLKAARATVAKVQSSPRRAPISLKPPRRESRMPPLHLYARVPPTSTYCTRDRGCSVHPAFPAPLCPENLSD
jgi:hypothetical protein